MVSLEPQALREIVNRFSNSRVLVIGDLFLDTFIRGSLDRISDEAPVPVLDLTSEIVRPGGAANAMSNIRSLGGEVIAVGVVGDDAEGRRLISFLKDYGIDIRGIRICRNRQTTVKTRIIAEKNQQHVLRIDRKDNVGIDDETTRDILGIVADSVHQVDAILVSDHDNGIVSATLLEKLIALAKEANKIIVIDSKATRFHDCRDADLVKVTHQVACEITGVGQINETSLRNIGQWMLSQLESRFVLITRGKDGMALFGRDGEVVHIPSIAKEVREAAGVADTVGAVIALSLAADKTRMTEAAILANTTAGIKVGKLGAATVSQDELIQVLESLDPDALFRKISR